MTMTIHIHSNKPGKNLVNIRRGAIVECQVVDTIFPADNLGIIY